MCMYIFPTHDDHPYRQYINKGNCPCALEKEAADILGIYKSDCNDKLNGIKPSIIIKLHASHISYWIFTCVEIRLLVLIEYLADCSME